VSFLDEYEEIYGDFLMFCYQMFEDVLGNMKGEGKRGLRNVVDWNLGNRKVLGIVFRFLDNN